METRFEIPGRPVGKARPRVTLRRGRARAYTPQSTADYEELVRRSYLAARGDWYGDRALTVRILALYPVPRSFSRAERFKALTDKRQPETKPDVDNIIKIVLDALNGVAYADDKQVVEVHAMKRYADQAKVMVTIRELEEETWGKESI